MIRYWKAHADMNEATAYKYWLGIGKLWKWLGKPEDPPRPRKKLKLMSRLDNSEETLTYLGMLLSGSGCPEQTRETNAENNSRVQNGIYVKIPERIPEKPDTIIYDIQNGQQPAQSPVKTLDTPSSDMESKNNIPPASVIIPYKALEAIRFILLSVKNKENEGIIKRYLDTAVKHHSKRSQQQT